MKKNNLLSLLLIGFVALNIAGCKKETEDIVDYTSLFKKNKFWTAEFYKVDKQPQLANIEFFENGQLVWEDIYSKLTGSWKLEKDIITFRLSDGNGFDAKISDNNKLSDIQNQPQNILYLTSVQQNTVIEQPIANTVWGMPNVLLEFNLDGTVGTSFGAPGLAVFYYMNYIKKGPVVICESYSFRYFMIMTSDSKMKGVQGVIGDWRLSPFELTKK